MASGMAPGSLGIRAFWWASSGSIIFISYLLGGSRVPNGITFGSLFIDCLPAYSYGEFFPESYHLSMPSGEPCCASVARATEFMTS